MDTYTTYFTDILTKTIYQMEIVNQISPKETQPNYKICISFPDINRQPININDVCKIRGNNHHFLKLENEFKCDLLTKYPQSFVKVRWSDCKINHHKEVASLEKLKNTDLAPNIIDFGELAYCKVTEYYENTEYDDEWFCSYIIMSHCGTSLLDAFIPDGMKKQYKGPGTFVTIDGFISDSVFKKLFPSDLISQEIIDKVILVLVDLIEKYGILHEDIHLGNFLIDTFGIVRAIDFECVSFVKR